MEGVNVRIPRGGAASERALPAVRVAEARKQPGVFYALTDDGIELPVVDVTHPNFALSLSQEQESELVAHFLSAQRRFARLPALLRTGLLRYATRGSQIAAGLRRAEGTFLDAMTTYLFKLGGKNLGAYALPVDRKIAASLPGVSVRLRLGDMARLKAAELGPRLSARPGARLCFFNIAGGPAIDSVNALLLLARQQRQLLVGRSSVIVVLDRDERGPAFGARALAALSAQGGPLAGLDICLCHVPYDWREVGALEAAAERAREQGAISIGSSEGGLFEYGADEDIVNNLCALGRLGDDVCVVGSVTRDNEVIRALKLTSTAATRPRGLDVFARLAAEAGYVIARSVSRPLSEQVVLTRAATARR